MKTKTKVTLETEVYPKQIEKKTMQIQHGDFGSIRIESKEEYVSFMTHMTELALKINQFFDGTAKVTVIVLMLSLSSCATLFTPKATEHQKHKPACGEPKRELRPGAFAFDLVFLPCLAVDFATGKIWKPIPNPNLVKQCEGGAK